jgi:uncharacterized protein YjdB
MKTKILWAAAMLALISIVSCNNNEDQVQAVRLDKTKLEIVKGESVQLSAVVVPEQDAEFEWFSENDQYVTVSPDGVVTAVGLKKAAEDSDEVVPVSVYVRYKNGADECKVTVLPLAAAKVEIVAESEVVNVNPGESITLKVKCYPENADLTAVTWSTDYAAVATVDSATGKVTGVAPGFARIRASYNDKVYDEINVNVNAIAATSVKVDPSSVDLSVGEKKRLTAVFTPSNATENLDVATVDSETGVVTAVSLGTAKIKVQAGSVSATCVVNVK